ncbi:MAG: hypothetical protein M3P27_09250 [Acidobacteriota bacterium]|nr:hypothetical protein [Acidobacteriota bacterium]
MARQCLRSCVVGILGTLCLSLLLTTPAGAQTVQVTSTTPSSAAQGTVNLNVSVKGKGFKNGVAARFVLTGTDNPAGVTVNGTTFVSSTQVVANINVSDTAAIAQFDVVVKNSDGRIGKGTELFAVVQKGGNPHPSDLPVTTNLADYDASNMPYYLQSDRGGAYQNGVAGTLSVLWANGFNTIVWGDWRLYLASSTNRTFGITFATANAVRPGDPRYRVPANPPYWGTQFLAVNMFNQCTYDHLDMLTMKPGDSFPCITSIRLPQDSSGGNYWLTMGGIGGGGETDDVLVSCNAADSGGCKDWFIDPIPVVNADGTTSPGRTCARLLYSPRRGTNTQDGDFYLTFHIHVTRP